MYRCELSGSQAVAILGLPRSASSPDSADPLQIREAFLHSCFDIHPWVYSLDTPEGDFEWYIRDTLLPSISEPELVRPTSAYLSLRDEEEMTEAERELRRRLGEQEWATKGFLRFLAYDRGRRDVGEALLSAAEQGLAEWGAQEAIAFNWDGYPFYHQHGANLSEHMGHVDALLRANGYHIALGEVFLEWPDFDPPTPVPAGLDVEVNLRWKRGRTLRPGLAVEVLRDGNELGACVCISSAEWSRAPGAEDTLCVLVIYLEEELQGHHLGLHLLQRSLQELHAVGYRDAIISTGLLESGAMDSPRGYLFYANHGFRVYDWTFAFKKRLFRT
jgi:GNAT superfamily N-acetyltransferase